MKKIQGLQALHGATSLFHHLFPCPQAISLERGKPSFCFTGQGKGEQVKADGVFWNSHNLQRVADLDVCGKVRVQIFIRQAMEQIPLDQLDEGMWVCNVGRLNFWSSYAGEVLRSSRTRLILQCYPLWIVFCHDVFFKVGMWIDPNFQARELKVGIQKKEIEDKRQEKQTSVNAKDEFKI